MFFTAAIVLSAIALASDSAVASPIASRAFVKRAENITDVDVLTYALTLEHLEATFYAESLDQFDSQDFTSAGYPSWLRDRVAQIAAHEAEHVQFLTSGLQAAGANATQACTYEFNVTSPETFIATAALLEAVGTSAYVGAASFVSNKDYLTAAASITAVEARHASWISSAGEKENPWSTAFETPLTFNQVYTIASAFITSCPSTNPPLPVTAFPSLTITPGTSGSMSTFAFTPSDSSSSSNSTLYAVLLVGLSQYPIELSSSGNDNTTYTGMLPEDFCGPSYVLISTSGNATSDADTIAGPAALRLPCGSQTTAANFTSDTMS